MVKGGRVRGMKITLERSAEEGKPGVGGYGRHRYPPHERPWNTHGKKSGTAEDKAPLSLKETEAFFCMTPVSIERR